MNRFPWIAQLYGYVVCIVAVVTFLISVSGFVDAAFERANPLRGRGAYFGPMGGSFTSYEAFRATDMEQRPMRTLSTGATAPATDTLTTEQMRARYEALRADWIAQASYSATQQLVKHGLLILLAITLFVTHWRWLGGQREASAP